MFPNFKNLSKIFKNSRLDLKNQDYKTFIHRKLKILLSLNLLLVTFEYFKNAYF